MREEGGERRDGDNSGGGPKKRKSWLLSESGLPEKEGKKEFLKEGLKAFLHPFCRKSG